MGTLQSVPFGGCCSTWSPQDGPVLKSWASRGGGSPEVGCKRFCARIYGERVRSLHPSGRAPGQRPRYRFFSHRRQRPVSLECLTCTACVGRGVSLGERGCHSGAHRQRRGHAARRGLAGHLSVVLMERRESRQLLSFREELWRAVTTQDAASLLNSRRVYSQTRERTRPFAAAETFQRSRPLPCSGVCLMINN